MKLSFHLKTVFHNISAFKLRTFLAMLGIMVGTASVVALISGGQLATQQALEQFKGLGTDLMSINFYPTQRSGESQYRVRTDDLLSMQTNIPEVREISPYTSINLPATFHEITFDYINIIGGMENLPSL